MKGDRLMVGNRPIVHRGCDTLTAAQLANRYFTPQFLNNNADHLFSTELPAGCSLGLSDRPVPPMSGLLSAQDQTPRSNLPSQPLTYFSICTCAIFGDLEH